MDARCKACRVVDTITSQNAEIRKNRELFSYYLPTFEHILQKYLVIEKGGIDGAVAKEKALSSCRKLSEVFEKMYKDLYADDMMDLSVEERALESIIKKDGY